MLKCFSAKCDTVCHCKESFVDFVGSNREILKLIKEVDDENFKNNDMLWDKIGTILGENGNSG